MQQQKSFKIVAFEKNYFEAYFAEGSLVSWDKEKCQVSYFSNKGIKTQIGIQNVSKSEDLRQKFTRMIDTINQYNDGYIENNMEGQVQGNGKFIFKKYKIKEYYWSEGLVKVDESNQFYMQSDDLNAKIMLCSNLYIVKITYLQFTSGKNLQTTNKIKNSNISKQLLQKYSYKYVEFPSFEEKDIEIQYQYEIVSKQFTIFNLPERWYSAIHKIWQYILVNKLSQHQFCYIDLSENYAPEELMSTKMPSNEKMIETIEIKEQFNQNYLNLPIFGKPNNSRKMKWFYTQNSEGWTISSLNEGGNIYFDGFGFWLMEGSHVGYRKVNKNEYDLRYELCRLPFRIRNVHEPERDVRSHLTALWNYLKHNEYLREIQCQEMNKNVIECSGDGIMTQQQYQFVNFKAYENQLAIAKFKDKVIVTMKLKEIKLINELGQTFIFNSEFLHEKSLKVGSYAQYRAHIREIINFYERVYYPNQWNQKVRLNQEINWAVQANQAFITVCQSYRH